MPPAQIEISLDSQARVYYSGERLSGTYVLRGFEPADLKAVEVSVLWHTEGKGDEDFQVHQFRRVSLDAGESFDVDAPIPFESVLPNSPLSYDGVVVKIRWCVRVRAFPRRGKALFQQQYFQLGDVPAARAVET
jgi:hypothetical protein